ncbi:MAG TPA: hypothetical protein VKS79_18185 [Gemmataceae bacterium]|nr:hypothetical protein [Gemmataceae bacterium]
MLRCNWLFALLIPLSVASVPSHAAPPLEQLLPDTTQGVVVFPHLAETIRAWEKTQYIRLANDPALRPFVRDIERQLMDAKTFLGMLGVTWDDVKLIASSPAAIAQIQLPNQQLATLALVDTRGKANELKVLLAKIGMHVKAQRGDIQSKQLAQAAVARFEIPAKGKEKPVALFELVKDDLLIVADHEEAVPLLLERWTKGPMSLENLKNYQRILKRVAFPDSKTPDLLWYMDAAQLVPAGPTSNPAAKKSKDPLTILQEEGFTGLKALGGAIRLDDGPWEMHVRAAIYAPPPFEKAMKMMNYPNRPRTAFAPPPWVPKDVNNFTSFSWGMRDVLDSVGIVSDRITGKPGDFAAVLKTYKDDPQGPRIDIQKEVIGQLSGQVCVFADCPEPVPAHGDRTLIALAARDERKLAQAMDQLLDGEDDVKSRKFQGRTIWEITAKPQKTPEGKTIQLPKMALAVANGHLLFANHVLLVERVMLKGVPVEPLATAPDYVRMQQELDKLGENEMSFGLFARPGEDLRGTYELARRNGLDKVNTMYGQLLHQLLLDPANPRQAMNLNTTSLPKYEEIRHYLQPFGAIVVTRPDGWDMTGITLKPATPAKIP